MHDKVDYREFETIANSGTMISHLLTTDDISVGEECCYSTTQVLLLFTNFFRLFTTSLVMENRRKNPVVFSS